MSFLTVPEEIPEFNSAFINVLADVIEQHEDSFDLSEWFLVHGSRAGLSHQTRMNTALKALLTLAPGETYCGTSACIAGWAAVIGQRQLKADGWQYVHVEYQAAHLMGLTYSVAYELFHKSSDLWSQIQKPTAAQAAWVLRYLATNGRLPSAGLIPS